MRPPRRGGPSPAWPPFSRLALGGVLTLVVIAAAMLLLDPRSFGGVKLLPGWFVAIFLFITDLGLAGLILIPGGIALILMMAIDGPRLPRHARLVLATLAIRIGFAFTAVAIPWLVTGIIKRLAGRARPFVEGNDPFNYDFWNWQADYVSFPSGHSTGAFAIALTLGALWPRARPFLWVYAAVIGVSRVVVSAHYPSDVLAGAVCGAVGALLVRRWFAIRRLGFAVECDGGIVPKAGPSWRRIARAARRLA